MRIQLTGGAYQARSVLAAAQRCCNLYAEPMDQNTGEGATWAYFPTAGSTRVCTLPTAPVRGLHRAINGTLFAIGGDTVYSVSSSFVATALGQITSVRTNPCSMVDDGVNLVIVDGSGHGWQVALATNAFSQISDPTGAFTGADRVDFLQTYFIFNKPGTPAFLTSNNGSLTSSGQVSFRTDYTGSKTGHNDLLVGVAVAKLEIWLIGEQTTEIWFDAGQSAVAGTTFPFQPMPNVIIDHGAIAKYSIAVADNSVFWLSRDRQGQGIVMRGAGYQNTRVSTYAIEYELSTYATLSDAIGMVYQYAGHTFYHLTFPSADKTWMYDLTTGQWSELCWIDNNGTEHRHRANCCAAAYDQIIVGDWQHGDLFRLNVNMGTDDGKPIRRVRSWPHMVNEGSRLFFTRFRADMETGTAPAGLV